MNRRFGRLLAVALALLAIGVPTATAEAQFSTVQYFGYYAARLTLSGGNHLAEVRDRTNLNWVQISDGDRTRPEVLGGCRPKTCIVATGHTFFKTCDKTPDPDCHLYPDYHARWQYLASEISSRIDKVAGFWLKDEAQWHGATPAEVATAARTIKETFPSIPVMYVEAGPKITDSLVIPPEVDWVGLDWPCEPFTTAISAKLPILSRRAAAHQKLFLMPEAAPLAECEGKPGHATDAEIAKLQYNYFHLAESNPRVIALLAFGFWTSGHSSADLPRTVAAHRDIARHIIRPPAPTPGPSPGPKPGPGPAPGPSPTPPSPPKAHTFVKLRTHKVKLRRGGVLRVLLGCSRAAPSTCKGRLVIRTRGKRSRALASGRFKIAKGKQKRVTLHIRRSARGRVARAAGKRRGYSAIAVVRTKGASSRATITLRR